MTKVIRALGFANGTPCSHAGQFLRSANFDAGNGQGHMTFTSDIAQALKFATLGEAIQFWGTASKTKPLRPDGQPNKPLTALTVLIEEAPEGLEDAP